MLSPNLFKNDTAKATEYLNYPTLSFGLKHSHDFCLLTLSVMRSLWLEVIMIKQARKRDIKKIEKRIQKFRDRKKG